MTNIFISCKESRIENPRSFYGCFYLGPFEEGQSLTVANALRRTLLSECSGLAIVSISIENVNHEYSTLVGVRDSILDILLNVKEIVLKKQTNPWRISKKRGVSSLYDKVGMSFFKPVTGYLKVKGPGIVRAKDLRLPPFIQCVDPNQYIATLSEDGVLNMQFVIMEGKGYIFQKTNKIIDQDFVKNRRNLLNQLKKISNPSTKEGEMEKSNENVISDDFNPLLGLQKNSSFLQPKMVNATSLNVDAVFSPVTKVSYIIEVSENKIVDKENEKAAFIDKISSLLESSLFLKKNFPFLRNVYSTKTNEKKILTELIDYVDTFSDSELIESYRSLYPLSMIKKHSLHLIILEIWTNGSLHPREALSLVFSNLASLFLNMNKIKIWNPIYKESSAYKKSVTQLDKN